MVFRRLLFVAASAALLGLVTARLAGPHLPEIAALLSRIVESPVAEAAPTPEETRGDESPPQEEATAPQVGASSPTTSCRRPPARKTRRAPAKDALSVDLSRGVHSAGANAYSIDRAALDLALRNLPALSAWIRVAPDVRDGKPAGFRLVMVDPDGPFTKLGLRTGDVLISVNGFDLRTPDQVLEAYAKLKKASRFSIGLLRDGHERMLTYAVK